MKTEQTNLFAYFDQPTTKKRYGRTQYGGLKRQRTRKLERPLSTKKWIHLVLKSDKAYGRLSFLSARNQMLVVKIIRQKARKFGVRIGDYANVGNHLHLKIKITSRLSFQKFLKAITTQIAKQVTGARKGKPFGRFWEGLAFTRILMSALEELNLKGYIEANRREALISRTARENFLSEFNHWVSRVARRKSAVISTS